MALAIAAFALSFAPPKTVGPPWLLALLAALCIAWVLVQPKAMQRDDVLPALAIVLSAVGLLLVARLSPQLAHKQQYWLLISLILAIAFGPAFSLFRRLAAYKYVWVLLSLFLFILLLVFGQEVNGARLWIRLGPVQYEPVELIKLFIVFFLAAYLGETADVIARARPWSIRANLKYLGPLFLGWGASMAILILQRDIGMAGLLLATFAVLLYAATRRLDLLARQFGGVRRRRRLGCASLSLRRYAHSGVAQSVRGSARRRLSGVARVLLACSRRLVRHRLPSGTSGISFRMQQRTISMPHSAKSSVSSVR